MVVGAFLPAVAYQDNQTLSEEALLATTDSEMKSRIRVIASQMQTSQFLFALILSEMILRHTDMLSKTLHKPHFSSTEGHEIAMLTARLFEVYGHIQISTCFGRQLS